MCWTWFMMRIIWVNIIWARKFEIKIGMFDVIVVCWSEYRMNISYHFAKHSMVYHSESYEWSTFFSRPFECSALTYDIRVHLYVLTFIVLPLSTFLSFENWDVIAQLHRPNQHPTYKNKFDEKAINGIFQCHWSGCPHRRDYSDRLRAKTANRMWSQTTKYPCPFSIIIIKM